MKPTIFLLCGLPFSGKTTYAKKLEKEGVIRFTLDEQLFQKFGRDFVSGYIEKEKETKRYLKEKCLEYIKEGRSVVLDFGFWKKVERDEYKLFVDQINAKWQLLYFNVPMKELKKRLRLRNNRDLKNNHFISESMLENFSDQFEVPVKEEAKALSEKFE